MTATTTPTPPSPTTPSAASRTAPRGRAALEAWVQEIAALTEPDQVLWCDGSEREKEDLLAQMVADGSLIPLDAERRPGSYLARSTPADVARLEGRTFICSAREEDAGPTNNWRDPVQARRELEEDFAGSMRGRTMYVMPFSMGALDSDLARIGVQITDSPYVVVSSAIMTRMGSAALERIGEDTPWVPAVHSVGMPLVDAAGAPIPDVPWPSNEHKTIAHFPETREIWSYGSGYGGNALLAKKCFALRIASVLGREEGWLAEHMLLIRATPPSGRPLHIAAAFPSACGKTNFAMMTPSLPGWTVETLGDDITWMRPDADGRLRAINPEAGFFGVAPGTGWSTNPAAMETIERDTIFTNVALTADGDVWWEGATPEPPEGLVDWQGREWDPAAGTPAAHPNGRFTVSAAQCPRIAPDWEDPDGVPLDAIIVGGRRATNVPLVAEARDWAEGVFFGATVASEQTAAAEGPVGELRIDPFAMLPFSGYDMAHAWEHWLEIGEQLGESAPRIFRVNWFRKGEDGSYLWPGFGENSRVIEWISRRLAGEAETVDTPIGLLPRPEDLDVEGLDLEEGVLAELFAVDPAAWSAEAVQLREHFARFGDRVPEALRARLDALSDVGTAPPS
ncbi:phosphoenolpyruvate carboxykinase (GTP) [Brachybacterium sp. AOP43-C2-M15]|uniref:phosphoenolpyruvate carboxykinase (GTP) n=1 Tax=Brachybacterium sp. AOP43-C2-M15 TaxID=3457661 RepID=UPI0040339FA0